MTARLMFQAMLTELNNTSSPSLLLDDYNYFINKAIDMYINKRYANYDTAQQTTDDLRVLKATAILPVTKKIFDNINTDTEDESLADLMDLIKQDKSFDAIAEVNLPSDYMHTLNCICLYKVGEQFGCYDGGDVAKYSAKRLTADSWSTVMNDYYNRPTPKTPYYYIHNINTQNELPTNPIKEDKSGTDPYDLRNQFDVLIKEYAQAVEDAKNSGNFKAENFGDGKSNIFEGNSGGYYEIAKFDNGTFDYIQVSDESKATKYSPNGLYDEFNVYTNEGIHSYTTAPGVSITKTIRKSDYVKTLPRTIKIGKKTIGTSTQSTVERTAGVRYGNASKVRMEIRYGQADVFDLKGVSIDYIKAPQHIRLTKNQLDLTKDESQVMEFPDYVCQEIINQLVVLVMANNADPRIQTVPLVSQSISDPAQQQQQAATSRRQTALA